MFTKLSSVTTKIIFNIKISLLDILYLNIMTPLSHKELSELFTKDIYTNHKFPIINCFFVFFLQIWSWVLFSMSFQYNA